MDIVKILFLFWVKLWLVYKVAEWATYGGTRGGRLTWVVVFLLVWISLSLLPVVLGWGL